MTNNLAVCLADVVSLAFTRSNEFEVKRKTTEVAWISVGNSLSIFLSVLFLILGCLLRRVYRTKLGPFSEKLLFLCVNLSAKSRVPFGIGSLAIVAWEESIFHGTMGLSWRKLWRSVVI